MPAIAGKIEHAGHRLIEPGCYRHSMLQCSSPPPPDAPKGQLRSAITHAADPVATIKDLMLRLYHVCAVVTSKR